MNKNNFNLVYVDNKKIARLIYNFIQAKVIYNFSFCSYKNSNDNDLIKEIIQLVQCDLNNYLVKLINQFPPTSIIKNTDDIPMVIDLIIAKWKPIIQEEIEFQINLINTNLFNKEKAS